MEGKKIALSEIVGLDSVCDSSEMLEEYSKDNSFVKPILPELVVKVKNSDEVQKIILWAKETKTPLVPISSKAPRHRGDTVPSVAGAVIVDMSGMNKILGIHKKHRIVHVEPGVTYGQLNAALAKEGLMVASSLAPKANKSVITSLLDIEPRVSPRHQWNYFEPLRGMGVIYGDGKLFFAGSGAMGPQNLELQWSKSLYQVNSLGPQNYDFTRTLTQSQGTMGIVVWAAIKCQAKPTVHNMFMATAKKSQDLEDFVYSVLHNRFGEELCIMNSAYLAAILGAEAKEISVLKNELPPWVALVGVAGRVMLEEMKAKQQELDIDELAQQYGLKMMQVLPGLKAQDVLEKITNPCGDRYWKERYKGGYQDIFFVTTLDKTAKFIDAIHVLATECGYPVSNIGVYIQPQHMGTSVSIEFNLPYDKENAKETAEVREFYFKASQELSKLGAFYSRPHGNWASLQLKKDTQNYEVLKKLKSIFDPNNIMNPGKISL